jgi:hypothetical protein
MNGVGPESAKLFLNAAVVVVGFLILSGAVRTRLRRRLTWLTRPVESFGSKIGRRRAARSAQVSMRSREPATVLLLTHSPAGV